MGVCCSKEEEFEGFSWKDGEEEFLGEEEERGVTRVRSGSTCEHVCMHTKQGRKGVNQDAMAICQRDHLIIANLGDSRAVLCTRDDKNRAIPVQLTTDQKPNLPSEAERIMSCKGRVFAPEDEPDVHRLWLADQDAPGLAMARAFGDFCLKNFGLISTPQVTYRKISAKDEFVVLATDGIWDVLSNREVVKIVSSVSRNSNANAAKLLVDRAVRAWRRKHPNSLIDDCAVICLFLKLFPVSSGPISFRDIPRGNAKSLGLSFPDSFSTVWSGQMIGSEEGTINVGRSCDEHWNALEGVSRANSVVRLPRYLTNVLSWQRR